MQIEVFEKLLQFNRCMETIVTELKALVPMRGFDQGSIELYGRNAEELRAGVNRYICEMIVQDADRTSVELDKGRPESEEEEP